MVAELRGSVPKLPFVYSKTLINRAWSVVRESNLWSFNLFENSWITPPLVTAGTVTATQGFNTITFDATAIAALLAAQVAQPYSLITARQFRISVGGIYSIIAYNFTTGVATLDRIFGDPGGSGLTYQIYQLYYPVPYADHRAYISVRNPQMFLDLNLTTTRAEIDQMDPQRTFYQFPSRVVPYLRDTRPGSATLGFPLFELWGQPVNPFTYQCYGVRKGLDLVNPSDTLPQPLGEELILPLARKYAYEWAEANKDMVPRETGPDFRFLLAEADSEYKRELKNYRRQDKEFVLNWFMSRRLETWGVGNGFYNTLAGYASTYAQA